MVNFDTREGIMKEWDAWVCYYRSGGGGTWPCDAFESLLDYFDERMSQVLEKSTRPSEACEYEWQHYPMKPRGFTRCTKCGLRR